MKLSKQNAVVAALVEGNSIRSPERMTGVHRDTIIRLTERLGEGCAALIDYTKRNLPCADPQVDEICTYVGKKQRRLTAEDNPFRKGDMWTYVALDRESKLGAELSHRQEECRELPRFRG